LAAFYLDNDVSLALAPLLQEYGHDVTSTRDLRLFRAGDVDQLHTAVRNGWVLVTYNRRDFTLLHDAWRTWPAAFGLTLPSHRGILALDPGPVAELAGAITALATTTSPTSWANELLWWRRFERHAGKHDIEGTREVTTDIAHVAGIEGDGASNLPGPLPGGGEVGRGDIGRRHLKAKLSEGDGLGASAAGTVED
jgi:hypothetical protein